MKRLSALFLSPDAAGACSGDHLLQVVYAMIITALLFLVFHHIWLKYPFVLKDKS